MTGTPRVRLVKIVAASLMLAVAVVCAGCHSSDDNTYSTTKNGQYISGGKSAGDLLNAKRAARQEQKAKAAGQ